MSKQLTGDAQQVLNRAREEARSLNHTFIGTEHILLALLHDGCGISIDVLRSLGLTHSQVHMEIEKLIHRGTEAVTASQLPFTPRVKQALDFAEQEAIYFNQNKIDSEHLLIGIIREGEGVAGQVLRNLGLDAEKVRQEVLKVRFLQMAIVERVVRPLHVSIARKRKMREELLAHLTAIYEEENARLNDPYAAINAAMQRFGNPAELAGEFQKALPLNERIGYRIERWFGWRAPESAVKYLLRLSVQMFVLLMLVFCLVAPLIVSREMWERDGLWVTFRLTLAFLSPLPVSQFVLGLLYIRMRDSMFGSFGFRKSTSNTLAFGGLMATAIAAGCVAFIALTTGDSAKAIEMILPYCGLGMIGAFACYLMARSRGPAEISDTIWASLPLEETNHA